MQFKQILLLVTLCANSIFSNAQNLGSVSGNLKTTSGEPAIALTLKIQNTSFAAISNNSGDFTIKNITPGRYTLIVTGIGYKTQQKAIAVTAGKNTEADFTISYESINMNGITVIGRTAVQESNRQAFNVTAIDAKQLYNSTLDLAGALDRVAGIRVRESGGVGSNFNLSLNGFSGNHIRYFIDGVPMDGMGSSFQINNIPINAAERIEVYKGVVPIWLGSDALGGAINIVTGNRNRNYIDASYSYGSFNTHRSVINAAATSKSGLTVQLSAFQNYSDNSYKTHLRTLLQNSMEADKRASSVRRFNDTYHNETLIANVGLVNKSFADNLLFGITLGQNYKEIQTAARPESVYGQLHRSGRIVMPTLKYKKTDLIKGLDLTVNANYNLGYEKTIDTAMADYDWDGIRDPKKTMGERTAGGMLSKFKNNNGLATAMMSYKITNHHSVAINNVFSTFNRKTDDLLFPEKNALDPAKKMDKNVLGFGYGYEVANKWSANLFGKYIHLKNVNGSTKVNKSADKLGYGFALSYYLNPDLQIRTSYELTNRMPEANEIFGDLENQAASPNLKPEKSDNINLGIVYGFKLSDVNRFSVTANVIYRYSDDFIYNKFVGGTSGAQNQTIADNREGVRTTGVDGEIRYSYKSWLSVGTTVTYQMLRNLQKYDPKPTGGFYEEESVVYLDQMPNIPYFFGNGDVSASFKNVLKKGNNLTVGYNMLYVHSFWLYWPSLGNSSGTDDKNGVPTQLAHDLNFVYSMKNGRYNVSLEAKNITDKPVFDNFSLQKPGRGFYLNLRYFINKSQ